MAEKVRVHTLAKELNVQSKTIVDKCVAEGIEVVKNHMSTLSAGLQATIREWFSESEEHTALETTVRVDLKKVRLKPKNKRVTKQPEDHADSGTTQTIVVDMPDASDASDALVGVPEDAVSAGAEEAVVGFVESDQRDDGTTSEEQPTDSTAASVKIVSTPDEITTTPVTPDEEQSQPDSPAVELVSEAPAEQVKPAPRKPMAPAGPQHVPAPAKLQGPRVVRYEAPEYDSRPPRRPVERPRPQGSASPPAPGQAGGTPTPPPATAKGVKKKGRHSQRQQASRLTEASDRMAEWRDRDLAERKERLAGATGRRIHRRRSTTGYDPTQAHDTGPKTKANVHEPIRMKEFCAETGLNFIQLFKVLRDEHGMMANINMIIPVETAELLALNFGIDLTVIAAKTMLDDLQDEIAKQERKHEQSRPPVVAMLGHVDHGKTSLLDAIRKSHVASGEDGGITQHISSYHIDSERGPVTFLDTPGHEAFAAMRARGAQITDVVVLVIAADDGIMPQTIEAINHAKAAGVTVVVALNKSDLGDQNKIKIFGQLSEHGLTPSGDWGGEIDVIPTSATTGEGVKELIEHLADLASVLDFKADPTLPATGTVIEAQTKTGVGPVASVLVRDGTLSVGDFIVCGNAAGKVRALLNDRGVRVKTATPSIPVEIWGLDEVPASGDHFYVVSTLQRAKDIAAEIKHVRVVKGRQQSRKVQNLQEMLLRRDDDVIPELNIIIKADVDGSVVALKQSLMEIPSSEVKLAIRHAGIGAVNDSDVLLAATSNSIIVAYRVDVAVGARRLVESHGVDVRSYRVIYNVCDDIKKALEGLLAPEENIESRATLEVRDIFRLSKKMGLIAGCMVTVGPIIRNQLVKIVRNGVLVREGVRIASLRRFKDDVKEVRANMECGIKLEGFDDVHVGDVIETYEIVKTARTL